MPRLPDHDAPLLTRIVRDTLDAMVSPGVRDAILVDAIRRGGLSGLPKERAAMAAFVLGPLRGVAEAAVGRALAGTMIEEMLRELVRAPVSGAPAPATAPAQAPIETYRAPKWRASSVPSFPKSPQSTTRPGVAWRNTEPATKAAARDAGRPLSPLILVATSESLLFETLAEWFDHRAIVERVSEVEAIVARAAEVERRLLVILDGKRPSLESESISRLLELRGHVRVVVCRATPTLEETIVTLLPSDADWFVYREPASLDHVAAECLRLVS